MNKKTGKSVVVRINDRGPYVNGRIIDLSEKAADLLVRQLGRGQLSAEGIERSDQVLAQTVDNGRPDDRRDVHREPPPVERAKRTR